MNDDESSGSETERDRRSFLFAVVSLLILILFQQQLLVFYDRAISELNRLVTAALSGPDTSSDQPGSTNRRATSKVVDKFVSGPEIVRVSTLNCLEARDWLISTPQLTNEPIKNEYSEQVWLLGGLGLQRIYDLDATFQKKVSWLVTTTTPFSSSGEISLLAKSDGENLIRSFSKRFADEQELEERACYMMEQGAEIVGVATFHRGSLEALRYTPEGRIIYGQFSGHQLHNVATGIVQFVRGTLPFSTQVKINLLAKDRILPPDVPHLGILDGLIPEISIRCGSSDGVKVNSILSAYFSKTLDKTTFENTKELFLSLPRKIGRFHLVGGNEETDTAIHEPKGNDFYIIDIPLDHFFLFRDSENLNSGTLYVGAFPALNFLSDYQRSKALNPSSIVGCSTKGNRLALDVRRESFDKKVALQNVVFLENQKLFSIFTRNDLPGGAQALVELSNLFLEEDIPDYFVHRSVPKASRAAAQPSSLFRHPIRFVNLPKIPATQEGRYLAERFSNLSPALQKEIASRLLASLPHRIGKFLVRSANPEIISDGDKISLSAQYLQEGDNTLASDPTFFGASLFSSKSQGYMHNFYASEDSALDKLRFTGMKNDYPRIGLFVQMGNEMRMKSYGVFHLPTKFSVLEFTGADRDTINPAVLLDDFDTSAFVQEVKHIETLLRQDGKTVR